VGVGKLLRRVMFDLGKDYGSERGGLGGGGCGVLGEDCRPVGYARIEKRG